MSIAPGAGFTGCVSDNAHLIPMGELAHRTNKLSARKARDGRSVELYDPKDGKTRQRFVAERNQDIFIKGLGC